MKAYWRRLLPPILAVAMALPGAAQQVDTSKLTLAPLYRPGQRISLLLETVVEDIRDTPPRRSYQAPVSLRVVRNSTAGMQLEWVAGASGADSGTAQADPILDLAEKVFAQLRLMIQLDAAGRYLGIRNEAELKQKIQEFVTLLIPQATAKISDAAARQKAAAAMSGALTPETLLSAARKEIDLFFGVSGLQLEAGKPSIIKSGLLNPFARPGALSGEVKLTTDAQPTAAGQLRVEFSQKYDPTLTMSYGSGSQAAQQLNLDDRGEYLLDAQTRQVQQVRHVRTIYQNKKAVRTETTVITVQ